MIEVKPSTPKLISKLIRNNRKCLAVSGTLLILLIFGLIAIGILCRSKSIEKKPDAHCFTKECINVAARLVDSMNISADPCEDFFNFACGNWKDENPNHGWFPSFSVFESIEEKIVIATMDFFATNETKNEPNPLKQSRKFYKACLDRDQFEKLQFDPIFKYLEELKLPAVPNYFTNESTTEFNWVTTEANVKKTFGIDIFIGFLVEANFKNRSYHTIYMGIPSEQSYFPTPLKKLVQENEKNISKTERYIRKVISTVIDANPDKINISRNTIEDAVREIINFTESVVELMDVNTTSSYDFVELSVSSLQNKTDEYLESAGQPAKEIWRTYIMELFTLVPKVAIDLDGNDKILINANELDYLSKLASFLSETPDDTLELFYWWQTVKTLILSTTLDMKVLYWKTLSSTSTLEVARPRQVSCALMVHEFLGMAVTYGIADRYLLNQTKPKIEDMIDNIKEAFRQQVLVTKWMDQKTKMMTIEKSKAIISLIGYPDWLFQKNKLDVYYPNLELKADAHIENIVTTIKGFLKRELKAIRERNDRGWHTDPITVNAYNYYQDNSITIPMAVLYFPLYHLGMEVLHYGSLGSILGHEMIHGFDSEGRLFDKQGNYRRWWSNATMESFESLMECFVDQYNNYSLSTNESHVNGETTLAENIADNGGLNIAYKAYKNSIKGTEYKHKLPGLENFNDDQLFYLSFASVWCKSEADSKLQFADTKDVHPPNTIRVRATLQNSKDFSEAFNCKSGSNMNPKRKKCQIW